MGRVAVGGNGAGDGAPLLLRPDLRAEYTNGGEKAARAPAGGGGGRRAGNDAPHPPAPGGIWAGCLRDQQLRDPWPGVQAQPGLLDRRQLHRAGAVGGVARLGHALAKPPAPRRMGGRRRRRRRARN